MCNKVSVPIIIPAYEPDNRMLNLLESFTGADNYIIIVDDGSGSDYKEIFDNARDFLRDAGTVISYDDNQGKGAALKIAFKYVLENIPNAIGVVTADSDGQHTVECIETVKKALMETPHSLILGVRNFNGEDIPWKSVFGNKLTARVTKFLTGLDVSDTQTGLRGIPRSFMEQLLDIKENRFEFEMKMLLESRGRYPIKEVRIKTIYDSKEDHQTHFNPVLDSIRIYRVLGKRFLRFIISSLSSCLLDLILFAVFCSVSRGLAYYVAKSTVLARVISAIYNYSINYKFVFDSKERKTKSSVKYFTLAVVQMSLSAVLVSLLVALIPLFPEVIIKMVVDVCLFFISYHIQHMYIFGSMEKEE